MGAGKGESQPSMNRCSRCRELSPAIKSINWKTLIMRANPNSKLFMFLRAWEDSNRRGFTFWTASFSMVSTGKPQAPARGPVHVTSMNQAGGALYFFTASCLGPVAQWCRLITFLGGSRKGPPLKSTNQKPFCFSCLFVFFWGEGKVSQPKIIDAPALLFFPMAQRVFEWIVGSVFFWNPVDCSLDLFYNTSSSNRKHF